MRAFSFPGPVELTGGCELLSLVGWCSIPGDVNPVVGRIRVTIDG